MYILSRPILFERWCFWQAKMPGGAIHLLLKMADSPAEHLCYSDPLALSMASGHEGPEAFFMAIHHPRYTWCPCWGFIPSWNEGWPALLEAGWIFKVLLIRNFE